MKCKIAFIFPGQGAQVVGMGKEIIENDRDSKALFDAANELLDFNLEEICFEENKLIHQTRYTQPALLTVSTCILKAIEKLGIKPDYVAGLSLGEYSALVANGALSFEEGVKLVAKRGLYMDEAAKAHKGSMAAVLGANEETIKDILNEVDGYVKIANYNNTKQIVVAGEEKALQDALVKFEENKVKAIPIQVSGAFHSDLMADAKENLIPYLEETTFNAFSIPYTTNVTGKLVSDASDINTLLAEQVVSSVRWLQCMETLIAEGVELFVEIGPSTTLKGLMKKIDRKKTVISVSNLQSLTTLKEYMESIQ